MTTKDETIKFCTRHNFRYRVSPLIKEGYRKCPICAAELMELDVDNRNLDKDAKAQIEKYGCLVTEDKRVGK